ncbi:MAG: carcinine hydrolase/isopenicillin-N N-acyltransferase family protein [Anaeroplasma sp.]
MKKTIKRTIITLSSILFGLFLIIFILVFAIWHNEISTVSSIKKLVDENKDNRSAPVYLMDVKGNYYFDDFIKAGGASSDQELIDFIVDNLTKGIIPITLNAPEIGCSSFTCNYENTYYFGRNYDFSTTTAMIVRTNPKDGRFASISSVDLQFLGISNGKYLDTLMERIITLAAPYVPLDGINEKGVSCGIYMSYQGSDDSTPTNQSTSRPDLTSTTMLRMILDYADSVDKAIELVSQYDLHDSASTSFHYMVADSTGKSAILEWVNDSDDKDNDGSKRELLVYYNDNDENVGEKEKQDKFQYITNFIVTPDYYDNDESKYGLDRYNKIQNMINPDGSNVNGVASKETALEVLKMVGRRNWDIVNGVSDGNGITVWSSLYDLTNKKVTWISNEEFDNENSIFEFDFSYLK